MIWQRIRFKLNFISSVWYFVHMFKKKQLEVNNEFVSFQERRVLCYFLCLTSRFALKSELQFPFEKVTGKWGLKYTQWTRAYPWSVFCWGQCYTAWFGLCAGVWVESSMGLPEGTFPKPVVTFPHTSICQSAGILCLVSAFKSACKVTGWTFQVIDSSVELPTPSGRPTLKALDWFWDNTGPSAPCCAAIYYIQSPSEMNDGPSVLLLSFSERQIGTQCRFNWCSNAQSSPPILFLLWRDKISLTSQPLSCVLRLWIIIYTVQHNSNIV